MNNDVWNAIYAAEFVLRVSYADPRSSRDGTIIRAAEWAKDLADRHAELLASDEDDRKRIAEIREALPVRIDENSPRANVDPDCDKDAMIFAMDEQITALKIERDHCRVHRDRLLAQLTSGHCVNLSKIGDKTLAIKFDNINHMPDTTRAQDGAAMKSWLVKVAKVEL